VPVLILCVTLLPVSPEAMAPSSQGLALAVLSGAVTSGLGYALWYALLPSLGAARAAVAQLTVPLIAAAGGAVLLAEVPGWRFAVAAVLVLGGVALASRQNSLTRR
jgi:drug/metabolite transporter (DMT)-like permease